MTENPARKAQLARLRAMMARTVANGCTEAEADQAATTVDRLLAAYEIDLDELTVKEQQIVRLNLGVGHLEVANVATTIARFCDCIVWTTGWEICFLGFAVDTEIAEYLTMVFQRAAERGVCEYTLFNPDYVNASEQGQRAMIVSFKMGTCARLGQRLSDLKWGRECAQRSAGGRDLVVIKAPLVSQAFDALGIKLDPCAETEIGDRTAYWAGYVAAEDVPLNQGVAGSTAESGAIA